MERITLFDIYDTESEDFIKYNGLQRQEKKMSKIEFNTEIGKSRCVIESFAAEKKSQSAEEIPESALESIDPEEGEVESESTEVAEIEAEDLKEGRKENMVEVMLLFTKAELFAKIANFKKLKSVIKMRMRNKMEKEVVIIYENGSKIANINKFIAEIKRESGKNCYITHISAASFISVSNHIFMPVACKILTAEEEKRELGLMMIKDNLAEISWLDPIVVKIRARIGDIISIDNNGSGCGLQHKFAVVIFQID